MWWNLAILCTNSQRDIGNMDYTNYVVLLKTYAFFLDIEEMNLPNSTPLDALNFLQALKDKLHPV